MSAPPESSSQISAEEAWLAGAILTGAAYGIVLALSWLCLRALWHRLKRKDASRRRNLSFFIYVCILFALGSLLVGSNSLFTQLAFINYRGFPGGPAAYEKQMFSIGADEVGNVSYVVANWFCDSMLVWRCVIIHRDLGLRSGRIVLAVMGLMQLTSYVLGSFFIVQLSSPKSSPYLNAAYHINWTVPYVCFSLAVNIILTFLIVFRLLRYRRTMVQLLGPGHATECTTVLAMVVESAAIYATFSLLFLIPFLTQNNASYTFVQAIGETQLIAPLLIIYREAQGKGWISSASTVGSSTGVGERDIRIGRFTDIEFASDATYSQGTGIRTSEQSSKRSSSKHEDIEERRRSDVREEISLSEW